MTKKKLNLYLFLNALVTGILIVLLSTLLRNLEFWITVSVIVVLIVGYVAINVILLLKFMKRGGRDGKSL